jgi:hypothetical protein
MGQGKEVGEERCGKRAACGVIAALSGRRAALSRKETAAYFYCVTMILDGVARVEFAGNKDSA